MKPKTMEVSERERDRYMQMLRDSRIPKEPPKGWVSAEDLMRASGYTSTTLFRILSGLLRDKKIECVLVRKSRNPTRYYNPAVVVPLIMERMT